MLAGKKEPLPKTGGQKLVQEHFCLAQVGFFRTCLGLGSWYMLNKGLWTMEGGGGKRERRKRKTPWQPAPWLEKVLWDHYVHLTRGLVLKSFHESSVSQVVSKHLLDAIRCYCVNCQRVLQWPGKQGTFWLRYLKEIVWEFFFSVE